MSPSLDHPSAACSISSVEEGPVRVISISGELTVGSVAEMQPALEAAVEGAGPVVVDLGELRGMDSQGLFALLVLRERLHEQALGMAALCHPDSLVSTLLRLSGADELMPVRSSRRAAIAAVRPRRFRRRRG